MCDCSCHRGTEFRGKNYYDYNSVSDSSDDDDFDILDYACYSCPCFVDHYFPIEQTSNKPKFPHYKKYNIWSEPITFNWISLNKLVNKPSRPSHCQKYEEDKQAVVF